MVDDTMKDALMRLFALLLFFAAVVIGVSGCATRDSTSARQERVPAGDEVSVSRR